MGWVLAILVVGMGIGGLAGGSGSPPALLWLAHRIDSDCAVVDWVFRGWRCD